MTPSGVGSLMIRGQLRRARDIIVAVKQTSGFDGTDTGHPDAALFDGVLGNALAELDQAVEVITRNLPPKEAEVED